MNAFLIEQPAVQDPRPKIRRIRLTQRQTDVLNDAFDDDPNPTMDARSQLAADLGMEIKQISSWFQNKRQKLKNASTLSPDPPSPSPDHHLPDQARLLSPSPSPSPAPDYDDRDRHLYHHNHNQAPQLQPRHHYHHFESMSPRNHQSSFQLPPYASESRPRRAVVVVANHPVTTKEEPIDHSHHDIYREPSPTPSDSSSVASHYIEHPTRTSVRARSARLATGPLAAAAAGGASPHSPPSIAAATTATHALGHSRTASGASTISQHSQSAHNHHHHVPTSRSRMSDAQREVLKEIYQYNTQPTMEERAEIAARTGMGIHKITNWFRNSRQSVRKAKLAEQKRIEEEKRQQELALAHAQLQAVQAQANAAVAAATNNAKGGHHHHHHPKVLPPVTIRIEDEDQDMSSGTSSSEEPEPAEIVTPWASPEQRHAHSFEPPSPTPHHLSVGSGGAIVGSALNNGKHDPSLMEDAMLLLHFSNNCKMEMITKDEEEGGGKPRLVHED